MPLKFSHDDAVLDAARLIPIRERDGSCVILARALHVRRILLSLLEGYAPCLRLLLRPRLILLLVLELRRHGIPILYSDGLVLREYP